MDFRFPVLEKLDRVDIILNDFSLQSSAQAIQVRVSFTDFKPPKFPEFNLNMLQGEIRRDSQFQIISCVLQIL